MLVDCGNLAEARNVFDNLLRHDKLSGCDKVSRSENMSECENVLGYHKISKLDNVIKCNKLSICLAERVWTSLIQGYVDSAQYECAFVVFHTMQSNAVHPSIFTLQSLLKACARTKCCIYGLQLHLEVIYMENETNIYVAITLIDMYAKCGMLSEAKDVFDEMHVRNVVSWNALLSGYVTHGLFQEALECYNKIKLEAVVPDTCTFLCFLKACCQYGDIVKSREMHTSIIKGGLDGELYLASAMVDSYAKCHSLEEARDVFERSKERDVVLWNTMIVGYAELGFNEDVLQCVEKMERESISRSSITYVAALRACGSLRSIIFGRKLHSAVVKQGFWGDSHVGTALITMYAKCGLLVEAQRVFEGLNKVDIVAWTTLIASYVDHGYDEQALTHFASMEKSVGVDPDAVAYYYCLKACGNMGFIQKAQNIHTIVVKDGIDGDPLVSCTLVDMYAKCGFLHEASDVFGESEVQDDLVPWNSLIAGYALRGESNRVFGLLKTMCDKDIAPDEVTFLNVLSACTHGGLIDEGLQLIVLMTEKYGIIRTIEHYVTMLDLFGRAGRLDGVVGLLEIMQSQPNIATWTAVLGACRNLAFAELLARKAFECAIDVDDTQSGLFLLMLNANANEHIIE